MKFTITQEDLERLCNAKQLIEKDYRNNYTIQQLAQKLTTNEYKLKKGFKQVYKTTIHAYLTQVRIKKAKELLLQTDHKSGNIAARVGFKEVSNFNKNFKKLTGLSPLAWKRLHRGEASDGFTEDVPD